MIAERAGVGIVASALRIDHSAMVDGDLAGLLAKSTSEHVREEIVKALQH